MFRWTAGRNLQQELADEGARAGAVADLADPTYAASYAVTVHQVLAAARVVHQLSAGELNSLLASAVPVLGRLGSGVDEVRVRTQRQATNSTGTMELFATNGAAVPPPPRDHRPIPEKGWTGIPYWLEGSADVTETTSIPFTSRRRKQAFRLIIRRVMPTPGSRLALQHPCDGRCMLKVDPAHAGRDRLKQRY